MSVTVKGHKAGVVRSRGGVDTPHKAACSCGWDASPTGSPTVADADAMQHLHDVESGLWEHTREHGNGTRCPAACAWRHA